MTDSDDNNSEHHNPLHGRRGIVVFSGGTAFNSAAAEMASRIVCVTASSADGASAETTTALNDGISRENSLVDLMTLGSFAENQQQSSQEYKSMGIAGGTKVHHVLPVTDDGGSTAEIVRVLGGPAVGDIRSRLLRLAPGTTREARAVRRLLGHRLVSMESHKEKQPHQMNEIEVTKDQISKMAREEWLDILEGGSDDSYEHPLWKEVSTPYRSIIRSFLVHFHTQVLATHNGKRHSASSPPFDFTGGSVGNFFFAGARTFFGSLPAAIFLFSKVAEIPSGSRVLPAVLTEERVVLGAELRDGVRIRGQYNISHPRSKLLEEEKSGHRPVVKSGKIGDVSSLHSSPIARIAYLLHDPTWRRNQSNMSIPNNNNSAAATTAANKNNLDWNDRHEIYPEPNPLVLDAISNANCIVYGCGSLFTSVLPSLVLPGVGESIANLNDYPKILLLNGWHDRETTWSEVENGELVVRKMDATDCVRAVVNGLDQGGWWANLEACGNKSDFVQNDDHAMNNLQPPLVTDYITHILYPLGTEIEMNEESLLQYCSCRRNQCQSHCGQVYQQELIPPIKFIGVKSIPANTCSEGSRSGGEDCHRVFHPPSLVDMILDLADGGSRRISSL